MITCLVALNIEYVFLRKNDWKKPQFDPNRPPQKKVCPNGLCMCEAVGENTWKEEEEGEEN